MRNWAAHPPIDTKEKHQHKRDQHSFLVEAAADKHYFECFPDPKNLQTPYLLRRNKTGMQSFEWTVLEHHIISNQIKVSAFWPNIEVVHPTTLKRATSKSIDDKYLYPWIPRLDAVLLTYTNHIIPVEIVNRLTVNAIGEVFFKSLLFRSGYPGCLPIHHCQLLYTDDNPIVRAMFLHTLPSDITSFVRLMYYDPSQLRIGGNGESPSSSPSDSPA